MEKLHFLKMTNNNQIHVFACEACGKPIEKENPLFYSTNPYHKNCVKCMICKQTYNYSEELDDYVCVTPGLFFCRRHYNEYLICRHLPQKVLEEYNKRNKQNFVKDLFNPNIFSEEDIQNHKEEDIYLTSDILEDSVQIDKPYDDFVPTIELHFDKPLELVDIDEVEKIIGDDGCILDITEGSIFIKMTFLKKFGEKVSNVGQYIKQKFNNFVTKIKEKFNSSMGKVIVGNLEENTPEKITNSDEKKINELYNRPSMNLLQNAEELNEMELDDIINQVIDEVSKDKAKKNWKFILSQKEIYEKAEEQVRQDIRNNPFELIIIGQTIIANKFNNEYEKIKIQISQKNSIHETFLYHGSRLANHEKIVNKHFLMPGSDKMKQLDPGYYGKGIYATDDVFYASLYGNSYKILENNQKTSIVYCRAIYNKNKVMELHDTSFMGKPIESSIVKEYGINHAYVGNSKRFCPVDPKYKDQNDIFAQEFVFPNKYQIIPICSFMVMKADHLILWKDENIQNSENAEYMRDLSKRIEVNLYGKKSVEEAVEVVKLKKYNKIKLITNGGNQLSGKKLIEESRKIIGSNFVCLVFARSTNHFEWVKNMENVLLTFNAEAFRKFAALKMNQKDVLDYIDYLEKLHGFKYKINKESLLRFPLADKKIEY